MSLRDYTFNCMIGEGTFSSVYSAVHNQTERTVAIKVISKKNLKNPNQIEEAYKEIEISKRIRHPFICQYFDSFETESDIYLILEFAGGGTLLNLVNENGGLTEKNAMTYFAQIVSAVSYLHEECGIVHRDLKAENILIDAHGSIRIIDFGLSKSISNKEAIMKTQCGSPAYVPPEMVTGESYNMAADIWSLGILLYAIVACKLPFEDPNIKKLFSMIVYQEPNFPPSFSPDLVALIKSMLRKNPKERATIGQVLDSKWLKEKAHISIIRQRNSGVSDGAVFDFLMKRGYNIEALKKNLLNGERSSATVAYNIVRRELETEKLNCLMRAMVVAPASIFVMKSAASRKSASVIAPYSKIISRGKKRRASAIVVPSLEKNHTKSIIYR